MAGGFEKYFAGEDVGSSYWIGVVEGRQDPLGLGRVQVRIFGVHSPSLQDIPTADLPWAPIDQGLNGKTFSTPKESDVVYGIWLDGSKQLPLMQGVIPGLETNPPNTGEGFHDLRTDAQIALAPKVPVGRQYKTDGSGIVITEANTANTQVLESLRHPNADELNQLSISGIGRYQNLANTVIAARKNNLDNNILSANNFKWSEPYPAYNPEYPYDITTVTESGHVIEYDDTPGSERIHICHRTGSFIEWYPSGSKVEKVTRSNYQIVMADDYLHVMGKVAITVDGDCLVRCNGDVILEAGGGLSANVAGDVDFSVGGAFNIQAQSINLSALESATLLGDSVFVTGQAGVDITSDATNVGSAGSLNLNAGGSLNAQGSGMNMLTGGQMCMTSSGPMGISGEIQINGLISINQGAPTATGAASAQAGDNAGLPSAIGPLTKNTGVAPPETVPVPSNLNNLDAITGSAFVQSQFLNNGAAPDVASVNTANCMYDITTKVVLGPPNTWAISQNGLNLIESEEGFAKVVSPDMCTTYPDPATGGQPYTIGFGTTQSALNMPVTLGQVISRATALDYLGICVENAFLPTLQKAITAPITQNMLDALLSFIYNVGSGNFLKSSVLSNLNQQNYCAAANALLLWNKAAGQVFPGLTTRRIKERSLFLS